jgi:type I restriction enzyme M protein
VGSLIKQSLQQKRDSVNLYAEAERLLAAELGLNRLDLSESLFNVRRVSDVFNSKRLDAEFYQEKYYRLEDVITHHKYSSKTLSKLIEPIKNGFDFREFTKEGTPYIRVGDVRKGRIDFDNAAKIPVNSEEVQKDVGIKVGDVLFTRKGTFGNAAVVRKGQVQAIISSEIMLLRLQKHIETPILPDYLALFLNSEFGYQQVIRKVQCVAYYSISQPDLAQVWVIAPPMDIQERLAGIIQASLEAEKDAKRLLAEAKSEVERLIEG